MTRHENKNQCQRRTSRRNGQLTLQRAEWDPWYGQQVRMVALKGPDLRPYLPRDTG